MTCISVQLLNNYYIFLVGNWTLIMTLKVHGKKCIDLVGSCRESDYDIEVEELNHREI